MPPRPLPPTSSHGFRPEKFRTKSTFRDYAIYGLILAILLSLIGGPLYYFSRSTAEKDRLRAKFGPLAAATAGRASAPATAGNTSPPAPALAQPQAAPAPIPPTESFSVYSGRSQAIILRSDDPQAPEVSDEFMQFVEALKISGVVAGNPAKAILNGKAFRAGEIIDPTLGVAFAGLLDGARKYIILRDKTGAELRLSY